MARRIISIGKEEAEFSPWAYEFKRLAIICDEITFTSKAIRDGNYDLLLSFLNYLEELYDFMQPFFKKEVRNRFEKEFEKLKEEVNKYYLYKTVIGRSIAPKKDLIDRIFKIKRELFLWKHYLGLTIPTKEKLSEEEKLERVI